MSTAERMIGEAGDRPRAAGEGQKRTAGVGYWLRLGAVAVLAALIGLLATAVVILPPMMAHTLLQPPRVAATRTPAAVGLAYEEITIPAPGADLRGWYVPGSGDAALVLVHGLPGERSQNLVLGPALHAAGFHLLLYDQRAQGASGGDAVTFGYYEAGDLAAATDYLRARSGARWVGAYGISMGAAVVLLAAGQGAALDAVVADSPFADLQAVVTEGAPTRMFLLGQLLLGQAVGAVWEKVSPLVLWHAERQSGLRAAYVRPLDDVARISPRPLLLIHGLNDRLFSYRNSVALYEAAGEPKELWLVPDAAHSLARNRGPGEYDQRIVGFFSQALAAPPSAPPSGTVRCFGEIGAELVGGRTAAAPPVR